jgi:hypothetical protein
MDTMTHHGSCYCGKVQFEFGGTVDGAMTCNCSICSRKGGLLFALGEAEFTLLTPDDELSRYTFNNHAIVHRFCKTCGMQTFAQHAAQNAVYVNLRCVEGIDLASVPVMEFDGRSA